MSVGYNPSQKHVKELFTGQFIDVTTLDEDQVDIRDIAHSLAQIPRHGGHCLRKIPVGQHCCIVHDVILRDGGEEDFCLAGLVHDAEEAYWGFDMPGPDKIRPEMAWFRDTSRAMQKTIWARFGVDYAYYPAIKEYDNLAVAAEIKDYKFSGGTYCNLPTDSREPLIVPWRYDLAEAEFLSRFAKYRSIEESAARPRRVEMENMTLRHLTTTPEGK